MNILGFPKINALGIKFDIAIKKAKVNLDSSFEQPGRAHIPNATYQVPKPVAFWFQRRYLKSFYHGVVVILAM